MIQRPDDADQAWTLIDAICTSEANNECIRQLDSRLRNDPVACDLYNDYCELHTGLIFRSKNQESFAAFQDTFRNSISFPPPAFLSTTLHGAIGYFSQEIPFALLIASVVLGLGLLIGSLITVSRDVEIARQSVPPVVEPSRFEKIEYVGRITGIVDCKWVQSPESRVQSPESRVRLSTLDSRLSTLVFLGDKFVLASGLMEITYDTGAKVILQGPCAYEVESKAGGFLSIGKLTARVESVEPQAANQKSEVRNQKSSLSTIHYPLFTIKTPTATVTDLGTEFGVEVSKEGHTTSHVFRGAVRVQTVAADGNAQGTEKVLHENESVRVDGRECIIVVAPPARVANFVREFPKPTIKTLDLVDVVAGGDGYSGHRNRGINPTNGRIAEALRGPSDPDQSPWPGDGQYHRVTGMPFIDGAFIPDGGKDKVQVDSAGHVSDLFRGTTNATWQPIWTGGAMRNDIATIAGDVDYASPGHGLVLLCSSNGITFDLEAIRRANPGFKLLRFRATAANTKPDECEGCADVWVLVDGKWRFRLRQINNNSGAIPVSVPISDKDRFLTLASTDGGDGISHDFIIFGDPRLELQSVEKDGQKHTDGH